MFSIVNACERHREPPRCTGRAAASALAALVLVATSAAARPQPQPAQRSPATAPVSFHDAVAAAWARLPQQREFAARQQTAAARYTAGSALFPNAPFATGSYFNDKAAGSNYNYITTQVELSTPVWLPGEGSATQNTAQAEGAAIAAALDAAHLALAAQLLDLATQAALAANTQDVAGRRLKIAQALAADLARRYQVGESSQSDALAADADAASAAVTLGSAEAQLGAARAALTAITGSSALPRLDAPAMETPPATAALAQHPRIAAAERAVAAAQANARLVRIANRDDPEIGLQGINEKQPGARWDTRFGVIVRVPFATEARNAPLRAAADQATTQAEVQLALARREVLAGVQQADAILAGAERSSAAAERGAAELDKRRGQIERAWRLGEMPLIELVRANAVAADAALARDKARTERAAARLRVTLAEGSLP